MTPAIDDTDGGDRIDLHEAARRLGVHYMTVYRYVRIGRLPALQQAGRWMVAAGDVEQLRPGRADSGGRRGHPVPSAYRDRLRARLLAGDEAGAWRLVESVLVSAATPRAVLLDVLAPAMRDIGDGWESGELSVGDEHRATAVATRLVGRLGPLLTRRGRTRGTVVVACAPGDAHALPAAMLATVLRGEGFAVVELGGDTPVEAVATAARVAGTGLWAVAVSVSSSQRLESAVEVVAAVRAAPVAGAVLVGGPAVGSADEAEDLGSDGWAADAGGVGTLLSERGRRP